MTTIANNDYQTGYFIEKPSIKKNSNSQKSSTIIILLCLMSFFFGGAIFTISTYLIGYNKTTSLRNTTENGTNLTELAKSEKKNLEDKIHKAEKKYIEEMNKKQETINDLIEKNNTQEEKILKTMEYDNKLIEGYKKEIENFNIENNGLSLELKECKLASEENKLYKKEINTAINLYKKEINDANNAQSQEESFNFLKENFSSLYEKCTKIKEEWEKKYISFDDLNNKTVLKTLEDKKFNIKKEDIDVFVKFFQSFKHYTENTKELNQLLNEKKNDIDYISIKKLLKDSFAAAKEIDYLMKTIEKPVENINWKINFLFQAKQNVFSDMMDNIIIILEKK